MFAAAKEGISKKQLRSNAASWFLGGALKKLPQRAKANFAQKILAHRLHVCPKATRLLCLSNCQSYV
jgi:hypothetical protein